MTAGGVSALSAEFSETEFSEAEVSEADVGRRPAEPKSGALWMSRIQFIGETLTRKLGSETILASQEMEFERMMRAMEERFSRTEKDTGDMAPPADGDSNPSESHH